ncbi:MAG: PQQ-binding-like beta-propeller repeat protein [Candidatus Promineifilaceae bacterium]|nr:PQQ-binding-like beta-propeller repeat protein [Candidatus Promineifilaceae bacterium]
MTITLAATYPEIHSVWFLEPFEQVWLVRTNRGIFSFDSASENYNWFVPLPEERFFSFKPFVVVQDTLVFSSQKEDERRARLYALDAHSGEERWRRSLNWAQLSHLAGISALGNELILLDWLGEPSGSVELQRLDPLTGELIGRLPAMRLNPTAIDVFGPKTSTTTSNNIYFCQRNEAVYQFGGATEYDKLKTILSGQVQQLASHGNQLFIHLWENGQNIVLKMDEESETVERSELPLGEEDEVASLIALQSAEDQPGVVILFDGRKGLALVDFAFPEWKWRLNDHRSQFDSAVWTPFGIACIVNEKRGSDYLTEIRILDEETGAVLEAVPLLSVDNWLSWQDGALLASTSSGLLRYKLSGI